MSQITRFLRLQFSDHSVPLTEEDPLTSMEGVFSHSVLSTEGVFGHSVTTHGREFTYIHRKTDLRSIVPASQIWQNLQNLHQIVL